MVIPCDLITDTPLHHLLDLHRLKNSWITLLLAPKPAGSKKDVEYPREVFGFHDTQLIVHDHFSSSHDEIPVSSKLLMTYNIVMILESQKSEYVTT